MSLDAEKLYSLLPAIYRIRDAEQGEPLRALVAVIADQATILEDDLAGLYDDQFIETCAPWVVPYIGDLIGLRGVQGPGQPGFTPRAEVANTVGYRRRKGTAAVLEQLARDVTGWPARAVEFFQLLATTQHMNHLRPENRSVISLRNANTLERLGGAFEHLPPDTDLPHTADVRRIASGRGRYNIPNVGIFLWRLRAYSLTRSPAVRAVPGNDRRFLFSPLGRDLPLFNRPETEDEVSSLATPLNVPMPIGRRASHLSLENYYGEGRSLLIERRGPNRSDPPTSIPATDIVVCDLSGWGHTPPAGKVAVDPALGRIAFSADETGPVLVSFHYGFSANVGGGEYDRVHSFSTELRPVLKVANVHVPAATQPPPHATIQGALNDPSLANGGTIEIADSGRYAETLSVNATGRRIELRAGDKHRPTVVLGAELQITGGPEDEVTLNGLLLTGAAVRVVGRLGRLRLRHCTLVPGATPSLFVDPDTTAVEIDRCILGGVRLNEDARARITDSVLDGTDEAGTVCAGFPDTAPGGSLRIENTTVIGGIHTVALELASNALFLSPVVAVRRQEGCVRFCYLAPGSKTPRRYRCQPETDTDAGRVRPLFGSTRYGDPNYVQLSAHCAEEIRRGADDESEMGAFHHLYQPQREAYLRARLGDYLRFGLEAGLFFAS